MREEESNWFSKWEDELPSPDELMPISQTLISRELDLAFNIRRSGDLLHHHSRASPQLFHHNNSQSNSALRAPPPEPNSSEFDSSSADLGIGGDNTIGGVASEEPARTLKRPRLVWTPQLHKRFVDAVAHLGIKNAVPKTIMQLMSVDGLTRENVASHLQKYRLYLKRMQGLNSGSGSDTGPSSVSGDSATDRLFASSPVPAHFLHQAGTGAGNGNGGGRPNSDHFMQYMPVAALHHQQIGLGHSQIMAQYPHHRRLGHYGSPNGGAHFDQQLFVSRQAQAELGSNVNGMLPISGYVESSTEDDRKKVLTLFPTSDD